jgi:hypothetical protein
MKITTGQAALLILMVTAPCSLAASSGNSQTFEKWIAISEKGPICNEGSIQLAHAGPASLASIEAWFARDKARLEPKVSSILSLGLLKTLSASDLQAHPNLQALAQGKWKITEAAYEILSMSKYYDSGDYGPLEEYGEPLGERKTLSELLEMRGYAVKPLLAMIDTRSAAAMAYGVEGLTHLRAMSQLPRLIALQSDPTRIEVFRGDYTDRTTIGKIVSDDLRGLSYFVSRLNPKRDAPAFEAEEYISELCAELYMVNALRKRGRTLQASSWDDYWRRAGPILEQLTRK